jgi:dynein heavy chain
MDPQKQALKFLMKMYKSDLSIYKRGDENQNSKFIENAISQGKVIIFDNINYDVHPEIENLFTQEIITINNKKIIKLNENLEIPVHPNYKYFLISYHNNPIFQSELYGKVSIINFTVTQSGLTEQLLSVIYKEESPNEELEKLSIMQRQSVFKETLKNCEEEILGLLNVSSETLLDNDSLINKLEESKKLSEEATLQINLGRVNKIIK